ncbi:hypothetical protein [Bacillus swezeyi]|uniref:DNA primase n=1 Tax=Bacillus swezeyi TaxID=1925020 RepID=A0A5M8RDN7_9BACI|nr:hypothetical protein [Bacillus swezeyi]KAA6446695.1 hypothetical protein DX927_23680 [Bacillus swezeyi]KAA6472168.1 hypothetical protein DX928_22340 [Bacillus swezeyi]TYS32365.1 hypothetical protein FZC77_22290 [Bacillus swezeyi]
MRYDKDKVKESLSIEDIHKILKELGSEAYQKDSSGNPIYRTVCHNKTNGSFKLYYYHEAQQFHCYTECGDTFDIYELVIRAKTQQGISLTFTQAIEFVVKVSGKNFGFGFTSSAKKEHIVDDWDWINKFKKRQKIETRLPAYSETVLDVFMKFPHEAWLNEGISHKTITDFEIGYYFRNREEGIVIPHRDIDGRLIGIRRRSMIQEDVDNGRKYMPLTVGNTMHNHQTVMNLYGLHKTQKAIKRLKKAMIFESEKSVLKCQDFYGDLNFTCAVCSNNISNFHRDILLSLDVDEVFIALDKFRGIKEGESNEKYKEKLKNYEEKILKLAAKFTPFMRVYVLWDTKGLLDYKDSPADKGKEVLEELMSNKIEIGTREGE